MAVCQRNNFIVIIKDYSTVSCHAEIFKEHVPGKNIGGGQLLDGITVFIHHLLYLLVGGIAKIQVERRHATFYVHMFND